MPKNNKIITAVIVIIVILGIGFRILVKNKENKAVSIDNSSIIFFYGAECPHCQAVEKYIADNQLDQKITFSKREVYHDYANANLMTQKASACGIANKDLGVPFLWASGKCYVGDNEVENFLNAEAKK